MIDEVWFEQVAGFAAADLADRAPSKLCAELGETYEVLPYLMACSGFSDWPLTRAALRLAAKNATRASRARPVTPTKPPSDRLQRDVRAHMICVIDDAAVHDETNANAEMSVSQLVSSVKKFRVNERKSDIDPSLFITSS